MIRTKKNTPKKKSTRRSTPKKGQSKDDAAIEKALMEALESSTIIRSTASLLDPFSGMSGCQKCGFEGPILSRFLENARHVRPNGTVLEVEGEHLMRACQWCQRSWLERCKVDSPGLTTQPHDHANPVQHKPLDQEGAIVYG